MEIKSADFKYLDHCILLIRQKHQWKEDTEWQQSDFEYLIDSIFEKTKVRLSLSTLKRIWNHNNAYMPRTSTLNALAVYIGFSDWQSFKVETHKEKSLSTINKTTVSAELNGVNISSYKNIISILLYISITGVLLFIIYSQFLDTQSQDQIPENIVFSHQKTVKTGVPTSILFNYDLDGYKPDSAHIQLSWNSLERYPIDINQNIRTCIYYSPGWHQAKLILNNEIVAKDYVFVETDGWMSIFRKYPEEVVPIYIKNDKIISEGKMFASPEILTSSKADTTLDSYYVSYYNARDFNVSADNFSFETRIKNPTKEGKFYCQYSSIYIYAENRGIYITFGNIACASTLWLMIGEKELEGKHHNLSGLGADFNQWQNIKAEVINNKIKIFINDKAVFETTYFEKMGKIKTWHYYFRGSGMVDDLTLRNHEGKIIYQDNFEYAREVNQ